MPRRYVPWEGVAAIVAMLVAVAAADKAVNPTTSPIDPAGAWRSVWIWSIAAGLAAYVVGVLRLRRRNAPVIAVLAAAVVLQLAPLTGPLLFSTDVFAYWDYGRLAQVHHVNPYRHAPDREGRYAGELGTSIYGPLFTAASEVHARAVGTSARRAEVAYRVGAAVLMVALLLVLARWAPQPGRAVAFVGWNPLLALHFAGGGHNDIWMLLLVACGVLLTRTGRPALGGIGWAASAFVKASMLAILPVEAAAMFRRSSRETRVFAAFFVGGALAFALFATWLYGSAWPSFLHRASSQLSQTSSISLVFRMTQHGVSRHAAKAVLGLVFVVGYLAILADSWRRSRPRLALTATLLILTPAWLVPWYGSWPVVLSALEEDGAGEVAALLATAYLLTDALPVHLF